VGAPDAGEDNLVGTLGISGYERLAEDRARAELPVTPRVLQPYGIVHGGAYASLAETLASRATYEAVGPELVAIGQSNDTSFLRAVTAGTVHAEGHARHRGRSSWVWDVEMRDDEGRLCALSRLTIAVRPPRDPAGRS
jgi:1,4-dihydroxy-2-naphthoyl-CoA hydrolase